MTSTRNTVSILVGGLIPQGGNGYPKPWDTWLDLDEFIGPEDTIEAIEGFMKEYGSTDWAILDTEMSIGLHPSPTTLEECFVVQDFVNKHGDTGWLALSAADDEFVWKTYSELVEMADRFVSGYVGEYYSPEHFAREIADEYICPGRNFPEWIAIDWSGTAEKLEERYLCVHMYGKYHYFEKS